MSIYQSLITRNTKISVIGLGYVGLPIALEFAKKIDVVGFDIRTDRIEKMKQHIDPSEELQPEDFEGCSITFTNDIADVKSATFHIIAVPTPIDDSNMPDLTPLIRATESIAGILKGGDYVVYEST
ncbi:MAG: nucleotide sugar dehydrogenase, partial [Bacteroidales bacterium]|nr:nucleotide sugar dehydrogenase [Bacteroidales bacterium]